MSLKDKKQLDLFDIAKGKKVFSENDRQEFLQNLYKFFKILDEFQDEFDCDITLIQDCQDEDQRQSLVNLFEEKGKEWLKRISPYAYLFTLLGTVIYSPFDCYSLTKNVFKLKREYLFTKQGNLFE
jgi:hypothetical protein